MRWPAACLLALLPAAAPAQEAWWQGKWAYDPTWCGNAVGGADPAPVEITASQVRGYEETCTIRSATELRGVGAVHLALDCSGEGESYRDERLLLRESDEALWFWFGEDVPDRFTRC